MGKKGYTPSPFGNDRREGGELNQPGRTLFKTIINSRKLNDEFREAVERGNEERFLMDFAEHIITSTINFGIEYGLETKEFADYAKNQIDYELVADKLKERLVD